MDADRKEILRYLGYRGQEADEQVKALIESCVDQLSAAADPRSAYREFPLKLLPDHMIDGGCFQAKSRNLAKNLKDCTSVVVFAATLGLGVDHLLQKYSRLEMSRAVVMQAGAAAMIEDYCNQICTGLRKEYEERGLYLRPRFSPGYGDFPLNCQPALLEGIQAGKRLGIRLTDSFLMMPSKSVTAVMGVGKTPYRCVVEGCEACGKKDCPYRR